MNFTLIGTMLADATPHHLPEAAEALRKIVSRQRSHSFDGAHKSVSALKSLGQISPQYRQEATHGLLQILMDQHSKSIARELATKALAEFGPTECEMAEGWLRDKFPGQAGTSTG